jgi:YfiR/HmsC-like
MVLLVLVPIVELSNAAETKTKLARETDLKAVFLFNFAEFVEWPPDAFPDETTPFVIGVLGDDPLGKSLGEIVANETVRNHKIVIRRFRNVQEITSCNILFISRSENPRLDRIFKFLNGRSILTVGETEGFSIHGGMVRFLVALNKLGLQINVEAAKAAGLTISSKLLRQAEILEAKRGQ